MRLVIEPISAEAFAPHGTLVRAPADVGRNAYPERASEPAAARPRYAVGLARTAEDAAADRHRHGTSPLLVADILSRSMWRAI